MYLRDILAVPHPVKMVEDHVPLAVCIGIAELRQLSPIQHQSILRCAHDPHVRLQHLRTVILHKAQKLILLEAVFLCLPDDLGYLLKGTEYDHAGSILLTFGRLLFEQPVTEGEVFSDVEGVIRVECSLVRFAAFTVLIVTVHIPVGTAGIKVAADVVRNVSNDELCFWDAVGFEVLEIIVIQLTFYISHAHPPVFSSVPCGIPLCQAGCRPSAIPVQNQNEPPVSGLTIRA